MRTGAELGLLLIKLGDCKDGGRAWSLSGIETDCEDRGRAWSLSEKIG